VVEKSLVHRKRGTSRYGPDKVHRIARNERSHRGGESQHKVRKKHSTSALGKSDPLLLGGSREHLKRIHRGREIYTSSGVRPRRKVTVNGHPKTSGHLVPFGRGRNQGITPPLDVEAESVGGDNMWEKVSACRLKRTVSVWKRALQSGYGIMVAGT